jgi:hypothetical protein
MEALLAGDWDGLAERIASDIEVEDRRPIVGGAPQRGRAQALEGFRMVHASGLQTVELRLLMTLGDHLLLADATFGTEMASVVALMSYEVDAAGRLVHNGTYEAQDAGQATADLQVRYRARAHAGGAVPDNDAIRFCRRWVPVLLAADWTGLRALFADDIVGLDHRRLVGGEPMVGADAVLAGNRGVIEVGVTALDLTPLATRGDRCVLMRAEYLGGLGSLAVLQLLSIDEEGRLRTSEVFDLDQADAALAQLAERAGESPAR